MTDDMYNVLENIMAGMKRNIAHMNNSIREVVIEINILLVLVHIYINVSDLIFI